MSKHYEQRKEANKRYLSNFESIVTRVSRASGLKQAITAHAESRGESVNAFVLRAITQTMERDNSENKNGPC